jgi:hypothetical protein
VGPRSLPARENADHYGTPLVKTLRSRCRGGSPVVIVSIVMLATALGAGALMLRAALSPPENGGAADEHLVRRGSFEISVPASGELAAKDQIEIRNKLEYRAVITWIEEEGTYVKTDDVLVRFAADEIDRQIKDAEDALNSAPAHRRGINPGDQAELEQVRTGEG